MKIITSWGELPIGKYQQLVSIKGIDSDIVNANVEMALILTDMTREEVLAMPLKDFPELIAKFDFLNTLPESKFTNAIEIQGKKFRVCYEFDKITSGQFIDISTFQKDSKLITENIHNLMAVLVLPIGEAYAGETHSERALFFQEFMPMDFVMFWNVFFCEVLTKSAPDIADYFLQKSMKMVSDLKTQMDLESNGAGI